MTTFISSSDYLIIADLISDIFDRVTYVNNSLTNMAFDLYISELSISDIKKRRFYNLINEERTTIYNKHANSLDIRNIVKSLQDNVYNNYGDVNEYLKNHGIKVSSTFAELSAEVGYIINDGNIGVIS